MRDRANRPNLRLPHAAGRFTLLSLALLALGCFLVSSAGAITLYYHPFLGSFGPGGPGSEAKFNGAPAVTVDQGSHDVYALDGQKKVGEPNFYRFTASGEPAPFTAGTGAGTNKMALRANAIAVAPPGAPGGTAGDIYATVEGKVEVYSSTGAHLGTIDGSGNPNPGSETAGSLAVDPAGDLYIGYSSEHLDKYVPTANPPLNSDFDSEVRFEGQAFADLAFTSSALYITVGEAHGGHWFRYPSTAFPGGKGSATLSPEGPGVYMYHTLTTDFSNGDLYTSAENYYFDPHYPLGTKVNTERGIDQYDNAGNLVSFTLEPNQVESDFDVDATSGRLYVPIYNETERDVRIYGAGEPVEPPTATIDPVTNFDFKSAHFTGTVNPGGSGKLQETTYRFECKPECPGLEGQRTIPGDGADHAVSDYATELRPETKYEVTLIAWNTTIPAIVTAAEVRSTTTFQTPPVPIAVAPEVTIDPVTEVGAESAHLTGTVDPKGTGELQATSYRFEYSSNGLVWTSTPEQGPIEGEGPQQVSSVLEGLEPNTTYRVRLHAKNIGGETTSEEHELNPTFTTEAVAPLVEAKDATHVLATSAQLNGHIDPRNSHATYHFQYVTEADFNASGFANATSTPVAPAPPLRDEVQTIRLYKEPGYGAITGGTFALGFGGLETVPLAYNASAEEVQVALEALASVGAGNVSVVAGFPLYYRVTFIGALADRNVDQLACRGNLGYQSLCVMATVNDGVAADAAKPVSVSAELTGLSPATTYRYRLIAASAAGETTSQDATFITEAAVQPCANSRSGFSAVLPDCRAYEMVSPVDKRGADVVGAPGRTRSSSDGEAVSYGAVSSFGDSAGSSVTGVDYMSVRGPDGWSTHPLSPFQTPVALPSGFSSSQFTGEFSGDLEDGIFRGLTPVPGTGGDNVAGVANLYLASGMRSGTPHFQLLSDAAEPVPPVTEETTPHINFAGASADFKHVVFETHDNLTPDASGQGEKAYEWTGGEERLVGILPDSACVAPPCIAPESQIGAGALLGGNGEPETTYTNLAHAISEDGSRILFTAGSLRRWNALISADNTEGSGGLAGSLYVRIDGQSTVQIDASERSIPDPNGAGRSHFLMATPDGKTVFFLSREELVNADTDGSGVSLYRYEADAPERHHLSLVDTAGVGVTHIVAMTPDTGYMYFLDGADLYVKHGSDVHRIAGHQGVIPGTDNTNTNLGQMGSSPEGYAKWDEARMSADGRRLLFGSNADQGLYAPYNPEATELYLYDYASDQLSCVSCSENGTSPPFPASFNGSRGLWIDVGGPGYVAGIYNNTPLSSDGRYVFFSTRDSLVAADTNGHLDAYSYDVETGKLHLISSGQCNCDSLFLTASPSGRDVFFSTHQQLVRADVDNLADIYDARIGGGIAAQNALPPAECQGDACQASPSPPIDVTPASVAFSGAGNLSPPSGKAKKHHRIRHGKHARRRSHGRRVNSRRRAGK